MRAKRRRQLIWSVSHRVGKYSSLIGTLFLVNVHNPGNYNQEGHDLQLKTKITGVNELQSEDRSYQDVAKTSLPPG